MKLMQSLSIGLIGLSVCIPWLGTASADDVAHADVIVLSTLHQLHDRYPGYSYQELSKIIERFDPDVLAVELTAEDLQSRREQPVKQEYQHSVFPLLDKHDYIVVPLEPPQPLYGELVSLIRQGQAELQERKPALVASFEIYTESLFQLLDIRWKSPADVNSPTTDVLFESKHRFQEALFGSAESRGWEEWNEHFLEKILDSARANPGKKILVLVGAEHAYWLRDRLSNGSVRLLDTFALLSSASN